MDSMKEVEEGKRKQVGRMGDWRKGQGMGGAQSREKMEDAHLYTAHIV